MIALVCYVQHHIHFVVICILYMILHKMINIYGASVFYNF